MTTPISKLISPFLVSAIAIIVLLLHIGISLWKHRRTRSSSAKDFKKLSNEATTLSAETERIRREANESSTADRTVRIAHLDLLCEADEWDTAIRICLVTWEDIILRNSSIGDEESGKRDAIGKGRQNDHGKQMIGVMHARCKEGLARRKELGPQLQRIHLSSPVRGLGRGILSAAALAAASSMAKKPSHEMEMDLTPESFRCSSSHKPHSTIVEGGFSRRTFEAMRLQPPPRAARCPALVTQQWR